MSALLHCELQWVWISQWKLLAHLLFSFCCVDDKYASFTWVLRAMSLLNKSHLADPIFPWWCWATIPGHKAAISNSYMRYPLKNCNRRTLASPSVSNSHHYKEGFAACVGDFLQGFFSQGRSMGWDCTAHKLCYWPGQREKMKTESYRKSCLFIRTQLCLVQYRTGRKDTCPMLSRTERGHTGVVEPGGI